jgi:hypothetical protein
MSSAFVGTRLVTSGDELKQSLETLPAQSRYYFLRWVHKVSGFCNSLPADFPSPKGEMLTPDFEVRWQQTPQGYDLLLLSLQEPKGAHHFQALGQDWVVSAPLSVHLSPKDTPEERQNTRYPKPIIYPDKFKLHQRYFQNQHTGTVHFVSLTLASKEVTP